jgi:hypothetical protein
MPYALEHYGSKAIVKNIKTGKHYSSSPIPLTDAKAQMRILKQYSEEKESKRTYEAEREKLRKEVHEA